MTDIHIRKATGSDLDTVEKIYGDVHTAEEAGKQDIGWIRGVYPTRATAQAALDRDDLFVLVRGADTLGSAVINRLRWMYTLSGTGSIPSLKMKYASCIRW